MDGSARVSSAFSIASMASIGATANRWNRARETRVPFQL